MTPHPTNTRARAAPRSPRSTQAHDIWFGIEQEYTFFDGVKPLGWPDNGFPAPQFGYYCGVGADEVFGRDIVEEHMDACLDARASSSPASTPRSCPAQWEFQIGPAGPLEVADHLWVARWLLYRIAEDHGVVGHARPEAGQGRLERRRRAHQLLDQGDARVATTRASRRPRRSSERHALHIANYGHGIEERLTGKHETCSYKEFKYGVSDRGASVRIPWQVAQREEGLHRGSPPLRQHGSLRRHPPDHRDRLLATLITGQSPSRCC